MPTKSPSYLIAGVDEVGRGCLAGPVFAAAVILPDSYTLYGLTDSKQLTVKKREALCNDIKQQAIAWALGSASVEEIDSINILQASLLAMQRAVLALPVMPSSLKIDGNQAPRFPLAQYAVETVVKGDQTIPAISAASIVAKVARDLLMCELDEQYPGYSLSQHKGYGTKIHLAALQHLGVSPLHRRSFGPVKAVL